MNPILKDLMNIAYLLGYFRTYYR